MGRFILKHHGSPWGQKRQGSAGSATKDDAEVDRLLYAGSNLGKARDVFAKAIKHRSRIRLTVGADALTY
jgi:hypothetical protein